MLGYMSKQISQIDLILEIISRFPDGASIEEIVETELMSLHEGNISRYGLRPSEVEKWKQGWF
jgi:hypothetical protein